MTGRIKRFSPLAALALALAGPAATGARAQDFDYYLLALTWTPSWCADQDEDEGQCDPRRDLGFTLHGLWPQYEEGWPQDCPATVEDPTRRQTAAMADIMGSGGLAWFEWKKHGRCTGLEADAYFARARRVYEALSLPEADRPMSASALEAAFLDRNPALAADDVVVTCRGGRLAEVRICLTPDMVPRACAPDVARDACRDRGPLRDPADPLNRATGASPRQASAPGGGVSSAVSYG